MASRQIRTGRTYSPALSPTRLKRYLGWAWPSGMWFNFWKEYGIVPLPQSGTEQTDIGHNVQWGAPDPVAADAFIKTSAPTADLAHSDVAPNVSHILIEPGKATIVMLSG